MTIGVETFATRTAAREFIKALLNDQPLMARISEPNHSFLCALLDLHPDAEKIGAGIGHFTVEPAKGGTRCFYVTRVDGSRDDFSTGKCLKGRK